MPDISSILGLLDSSRSEDQKAGLLELRAFAKQYARNIRPLYHVIPWSDHIVSAEAFRDVYVHTIELTGGLRDASTELLAGALRAYPPSLMVFRLMSAYQWAELADIVALVRGVRIGSDVLQRVEKGRQQLSEQQIQAISSTIFDVIAGREMKLPETLDPGKHHTRNAKVDTKEGWLSVARAVEGPLDLGHLLYERYTGRPFAYVRDALSEAKGDVLEEAVETLFKREAISCEPIKDNRLEGFSQAPDFALPGRKAPKVLIEAKLIE